MSLEMVVREVTLLLVVGLLGLCRAEGNCGVGDGGGEDRIEVSSECAMVENGGVIN